MVRFFSVTIPIAPLAIGQSLGSRDARAFDLCRLAQKIDESLQWRASVSTAGVIEKKTIDPRWCPVVEYGFELTLSNKRLDAVGMGLQKAQSVSRSPERKWHIVYDKRAIHRDFERLAVLREAPGQ